MIQQHLDIARDVVLECCCCCLPELEWRTERYHCWTCQYKRDIAAQGHIPPCEYCAIIGAAILAVIMLEYATAMFDRQFRWLVC